jgi:uncharacterized protein with PQ loop repeat
MIVVHIDEKNKHHVARAALIAGIIQPLITLPQIITIYSNQSAQDVSLVTWLGYLVFGITFLVYGVIFRLTPIWVSQILWVSMQIATVIGILLYS